MAGSRSGLYDDPMIYDILHAPGTAEEVDGLEAIEGKFVPAEVTANGRRWLEPACGSGRYLREAARRGIGSMGLDLNQGMIEYARAHAGPPGRVKEESAYIVAEMTDFAHRLRNTRFSFAFNLINTIRHLPSDGALVAHLGEVARALVPGGAYVVGLSMTAYGCECPTEDVWAGARGRVRVTQVVQYLPPKSMGNPRNRGEKVISHLRIERPTGTEHRESTYQLRTYSCAQWEAAVAKSPLCIVGAVDEIGERFPAADGGYHLFVLGHRR